MVGPGKRSSVISVGEHQIGASHPCFIIAEIGVNHNGDMNLARRLIDAAHASGANAVKFQSFNASSLATIDAPKARYQLDRENSNSSQWEMLKELELTTNQHRDLFAYCRAIGITFLSSPFDEGNASFLAELGVPAIKIPSGELTNHPLLSQVGRLGLPILLSSGMATLLEVEDALNVFENNGNPPIALFHCVSSYPAPLQEINLLAMETLRRNFSAPVGFSDHTEGMIAAIAAVALGANMIEKHVTLDRSLPGPDHLASIVPEELKLLVNSIRETEMVLGSQEKVPQASEQNTASVARKSIHYAHDIPKGHILSDKDLVALRPGTGMPPSRLSYVCGKTLSRSQPAGTIVCEDDLE